MKNKQVKLGALLSYVMLVINIIFGMLIIPFITRSVGTENYGIYKAIASYVVMASILDFGIETTVLRFVSNFKARGEKEKINSYMGMIVIQSFCTILLILIVTVIMYVLLPSVFNKFDVNQMALAKKIFILVGFNMVFIIIDNIFIGLINGFNKFIASNSFNIFKNVIRIILVLIVFTLYDNILFLLYIDLFLKILFILLEIAYTFFKLKIKIDFKNIRFKEFMPSLRYSLLLFVQAIALQINNSVDNVIIGSLINPVSVTIYSFGILTYTMYVQLSSTLSKIMIPTINQKIADGASNADLQKVVEKVGMFQFTLIGAVLIGFIIIGPEFIFYWLGPEFSSVYYIILILITPATLSLISNITLSIVKARNEMKFRTYVLIISVIVNIVMTVILVGSFGFQYAAVGTGFTSLMGLTMMSVYYTKKWNFNIFRMFYNIMKKPIIALIIPSIVLILSNMYFPQRKLTFLIKILLFGIVYFGCLLLVFKKEVREILDKKRRKKNEN